MGKLERKKNWFRRHWIISSFLVLILLIIVVAAFGFDPSTTSSTNGNSNIDSNKETIYGLEERFTHGDFAYTLHGVETTESVGNEYAGKDAAGNFLILDLTIENIVQETETFWGDAITIIDDQERVFEPDSEAWIYLGEDNNFFLEQMQPGLPKRGKIVFDVPADINGKFRISKGGFSNNYVYVSWS